MPCLLGLIGFFFPRIVLVILYFVGYTQKAFNTALWPILGFIFAPFTTLAYAWAMVGNGGVHGLGLAAVVLGVLLDIGVIGGGSRAGKKKKKD